MKGNQRRTYILVSLVLLLSIVYGIRAYTIEQWRNDYPQNICGYDFIFIYGVKAGRNNPVNKLDTFNDVFTKDMVLDPPITFDLQLPDSDIQGIVDKMVEIDFLGYPSQYAPKESGCHVTPYTTYDLKVYYNGLLLKHVRMDSDRCINDASARRLRSLFSLIMEAIQETEAFKASKKPTSGYC